MNVEQTGTTSDHQAEGAEAELRVFARRFVLSFSGALTALRTGEKARSRREQGAVDALAAVAGEIVRAQGSLELRVVGELLYVNALRLRHDLDNYVSFGHVLGALRRAGAGVVRCEQAPSSREWEVFLTSLLFVGEADEGGGRISRFQQRGTERLVRHIYVGPPIEGEGQLPDEIRRREAAKKTYAHSVAVTKELFKGARMGRATDIKEVRHALHDIVDQILDNEASLSGLSTLKDYDDYAFTHSVNVCIFCVALGKRLGLTKAQLYDLGMAALIYDLGMSRIPREIVIKAGELTPKEQQIMESHTWLGALSIFELRDFGEVPVRSMIAAYEHHIGVDGTGYPVTLRSREPSIFSRIIAVADSFDAATKPRAYTDARPADEVLRELWNDRELGFDPVVVKALINLLGIYPVGTLVILDTFELAIVHAANPDMSHIHRPTVRIISDVDGTWLDDPPLADLAEPGPQGHFTRSIIKVTDPGRYGIEVSDYFV